MGDLIEQQFQEIVVIYPSYNTYPEYKGKPYFSIKYTEYGQEFVGYGTYKPDVLSEYLKKYFMPSAEPEYQYRWIPCSERMPEKDGRYLCTVGSEYRNPREMIYAPQEWDGKSDDATWKDPSGYYVYDWFVKAWMPLPEPYKEGDENE